MDMRRVALAVLLFLNAALACAQFPNRPIRLIVPVPPAGAPDITARIVAEKLGPALGTTVVVENKPGSNGNIGAEVAAHAPADGYTLLLGQDSLLAINPHLYQHMPIDVLRDLMPISTLVSNMFVLSVNPSVPAKTFAEFIEYAKKADPPLTYASGGNGSQHHLTMEQLKQHAGINLLHVPYKGGGPATVAIVAGEVAVMFAGTSTAPQIKAGKLRALAVTGAKRSELFPDLPTIGEFYPGFEMTIWLGLFAPAGTPDAVVTKIREATVKVLGLQDVKERLAAAGGLQPLVLPPSEFAAMIQRDHAKFQKLVREVGAKVD